jgi:hypothetical protein
VYLAEIPPMMFETLRDLIGPEARQTLGVAEAWSDLEAVNDRAMRDVSTWEDHVRQSIEEDVTIPETQRQAVKDQCCTIRNGAGGGEVGEGLDY